MPTERLFVHVPFRLLDQSFPLLLERKLQPEIAFTGPDLDRLPDGRLGEVAARLADAGLAATVHAPFHDLNPGALEPLVLDVTCRRYRQALRAAAALGARRLVFHPGYEYWKYGGQDRLWLEHSLRFWPPLIEEAADLGVLMVLENIFEQRPSPLVDLLNALDSPWLGHCFDVGHWHLFAKVPMEEWFGALGQRTLHLHLHDNRAQGDDHLPVGEGAIDFPALFSLVADLPQPPTMTLEAHDRQAMLRSLANVAPFLAT